MFFFIRAFLCVVLRGIAGFEYLLVIYENMRKIYFNTIIIYDALKERAFKADFNPGINIITSGENHVGKSCLVKSLYYALGADINFASSWDLKNKTVYLKFTVGEEECQIIRHQKSFLLIASIACLF